MRRFFSFLFLLLTIYAYPQSTTVSATVVDQLGVVWTNASGLVTFVQTPGVQGPYNWAGGSYNPGPIPFTTDGAGHFSISLPSNTAIVPSGSTWNFSIAPNQNSPSVSINVGVTGTTQDISSTLTDATTSQLVASQSVPRAYGDSSVQVPPNMGQMYFDTSTLSPKYWDGTSWITFPTTSSFCLITNCVIKNPSATQVVTQPVNTNFAVVTSGTGIESYNGSEVLTRATGVQLAPAATQVITQPAGTTLQANNVNSTAYINGNGSTDNSAAIQTAVNACVTSCRIVLVNTVVAAAVNLPVNVDIYFTAVGPVRVTSTSQGFLRLQNTNTTPVQNRIYFTGITFIKANTGIVIWDDLVFNSGMNQGIVVKDNHFILSAAGAVGVALSGDSGVEISGNTFDNQTASSNIGTAIETIADNVSGNTTIRTPMIVSISNNFFRYVVGFAQIAVNAGADLSEGFVFTGNHFNVSSVGLSGGNEMNFVGNEFVASFVNLHNLTNSIFNANYSDTGINANGTLLTVDNVIHQTIEGNIFLLLQPNTTGVGFQNSSGTGGTTNVTLSGNIYVGANNTTTGGSGILFNDALSRNVVVEGESFRLLYAALKFTATLDRSTIGSIEARDIIYYAQDIATYAGSYLIAPHLYQIFDVDLRGTVWTAGGTTTIAAQNLNYQMFPGETIALSQTSPDTCSTGATFSAGLTPLRGNRFVVLTAGPTAAAGQAFCDFTVTLNGSVYVPPR